MNVWQRDLNSAGTYETQVKGSGLLGNWVQSCDWHVCDTLFIRKDNEEWPDRFKLK